MKQQNQPPPCTNAMNTIFDTTDIVLAAYLYTQKCTLKSVNVRGTKGTFVFEHVDPALVTQFDLGQARVEPFEFNNAVKQLTTACRRSKE